MEAGSRERKQKARITKLTINLDSYTLSLRFSDHAKPLQVLFDKPSRRFYFALIALVVAEMKKQGKQGFVHVRKHEETMRILDRSLAGRHASGTASGMWEKIRKAWHYTLPDLEGAAHFKIVGRNLIPPYEKGGKHRYECRENECDIWAALFDQDEGNPWRLKFAVESASLSLGEVSLRLGDLRDHEAWEGFLADQLPARDGRFAKEPESADGIEPSLLPRPRWRRVAAAVTAAVLLVAVAIAVWHFVFRSSPGTLVPDFSEKPSLAVLPFVNIGDNPEKEYFADGLTEDIITNLAKLEGLRVISRTSSFFFKKKDVNIRDVSAQLNVSNVLGIRKIPLHRFRVDNDVIPR